MQEFKIPELGENVAQGDVTRVLVKVGDTIEQEQPVVELETDKATIEVPSSVAGRVTEIKIKPGDTVKVGAVVLTVDGNGSKPKAQASASAEGSGETSPKQREGGPNPKEETDSNAQSAEADKPAEQAPEPRAEKEPRADKVVSMSRAAKPAPEPAK